MAQRGRPKKQPTIIKLDTKDKTNSSNTSESVILTEDYNFASNIRLKKVGVKVALTAAQVKEYKKCADDPVYFIEKYVKFMTLDKGITNVSLYDFQKDLINTYHDNRMVIVKCGRQLGKCQRLNTLNRIRDKNGKVYELTAEQLYKWLSFRRDFKEIIGKNK